MTELDQLLHDYRERTPVDDAIEHDALESARRRLRRAVAAPAVVPRRRSSRFTGRIAFVGGLAAALAVVVALLPGGAGKDAGQLAPAPASAQAVLQQAARAVSRQAWQPLRAGQYFYYRSTGGSGRLSARAGEIQDVWVGANGYGRIVQTGPDTLLPGGEVLLFHATAQQLRAERERQRHGRHLRILAYSQKYHWVDLDYQQLLHLPSEVAALQRFIEHHATGGGPRFSDIFGYVEGVLLGSPPVSPRVTAGLYHVIARLPGMRLVGPTRDALGRRGVAVGLFFPRQPGRIELIFDPRTGALLGERSVSLNAKIMHAPVGSIISWSVIERRGVVGSDTGLPAAR